MYDEDPGLRVPVEEARQILEPPPAPLPPSPTERRRAMLGKIAMGALVTVSIAVALFFAAAPFTAPKLKEVVASVQTSATPTPPDASASVPPPSASPSESATPSASAPGPAPTARPPVRTPVRTPTPPQPVGCDTRTYRITGRVTLSPENIGLVSNVNLYRASDGAFLGTTRTDNNGNYAVTATGNTAYKLFFNPTVNAKSEWWNDKASQATANVINVCRGDVNGVNVVITR